MILKQLSSTVVLNKATQGTRLANYLNRRCRILHSYFLFGCISRNTFCDRNRCPSTIFYISG